MNSFLHLLACHLVIMRRRKLTTKGYTPSGAGRSSNFCSQEGGGEGVKGREGAPKSCPACRWPLDPVLLAAGPLPYPPSLHTPPLLTLVAWVRPPHLSPASPASHPPHQHHLPPNPSHLHHLPPPLSPALPAPPAPPTYITCPPAPHACTTCPPRLSPASPLAAWCGQR